MQSRNVGISPEVGFGHLTHPKYRREIDGLRAIAVLSVVGFHAFPNWVKGGFVGVDIFFVISGFLISTIVFGSLERDAFSFLEFYSRRIRRIFPALLVVLVTCIVFGWFSLLADEYKQFGKHIVGGAGFMSNFILWRESGYFDNAADTKPLLHLWSLGIEEQFYIVWPLLLWRARKRRFSFLTTAVVIAIASFVYNIAIHRSDPVADFYSPQTRFWELLAGSLLACGTLHNQSVSMGATTRIDAWVRRVVATNNLTESGSVLRNTQSALGVCLIAVSLFAVTKERYFPGFWALLPVLGAVLIMGAGTHAWFNRTVLSNRVLVWFGLISFPLYLWHWPLLSFARIVVSDTPSRVTRIAAVLLSIALAWLTYVLLEKPLRFGQHVKLKTVALVLLMAMVGFAGYITYRRDGMAFRLKERSEFLSYFENERPAMHYFERLSLSRVWRPECAFFDMEKYRANRLAGDVTNSVPRVSLDKTCFERDQRYEKAVMLWGDSHAQHLAPGLDSNMPKNWQVLQVASSGCVPSVHSSAPSQTSQCDQSNFFALQTIINAKPDVVVVAQALGHTTKGFLEIAEKLKMVGVKRVVFVGPTPQWTTELPKLIARKLWLAPRRTYVGINQSVLALNAALQSESSKTDGATRFANVIDVFCDSDGCITYLGSDRKIGLTTWDYGHLTPVASDFLAKNLLVPLITDQHR